MQRLGGSEKRVLVIQSNLASTYAKLGRFEESLHLRRDVFSRTIKLYGEGDRDTHIEANNYASALSDLSRYVEAKKLLRKMIPVARRALGESAETTLRMRWVYAMALCNDPDATLDDLPEAVTMLEDTAPTARRVLGGAHPLTADIERYLRLARDALRAREDFREA